MAAALGDATTVVNVGAGAGSYEPGDRWVVAVEPSDVMVAQRPAGAAPAVRGGAEHLPFPDGSFDAAMAMMTVHHWADPGAGLAEVRRVARRAVVLTFEPAVHNRFWLFEEYLPAGAGVARTRPLTVGDVVAALGGEGCCRVDVVPVPADCEDGFTIAWWRRPSAYLDPDVRAGMSGLAALDEDELRPGLTRLAADLDSGRWYERHADLLDADSLDLGLRLVLADFSLR